MPQGKPAGMLCVQLDEQLRCRLFGQPERPRVCRSLQPSAEMCGDTPVQALRWLGRLDALTAPPLPPALAEAVRLRVAQRPASVIAPNTDTLMDRLGYRPEASAPGDFRSPVPD